MAQSQIGKRHSVRTIELKEMFHSLANAVRTKGKEAFVIPIAGGGMMYSFRMGDNVCTYSFTKGGAL